MKKPALIYSETELVAALKARDVEAYKYFYDNYSRAIFSKILSIVNQKEEAEDILQNAFVQIFQNISTYDSSKGRFYTWALNVAKNKAIDFIRSVQASNRRRTTDFDSTTYKLCYNIKVEDNGLKKILNTLPADGRMLIDLAYFKGLTYLQIAHSLNLPLGTVKTKIRSVLTKLRAVLVIETG